MPFCVYLLILLTSAHAFSKTTRFEVKDAAYRNLVYFISDALYEKVLGRSQFVTGYVELDPLNLKAGVRGELEVDLRSFEMGPESLTAKLREVLFSVADFPGAQFKVERLAENSANELGPKKPVFGKVVGVLTARGVAARHEATVKVIYFPENDKTQKKLPGNLLKVNATLDVGLASFKVAVPDALVGRLAPTLRINVDFVATDQMPVAR
jgi:polyisoprenoid-binding protein YceI